MSEYLFLSSMGCLVDKIPPLNKIEARDLDILIVHSYPALSASLVTSVDDSPWDIM